MELLERGSAWGEERIVFNDVLPITNLVLFFDKSEEKHTYPGQHTE